MLMKPVENILAKNDGTMVFSALIAGTGYLVEDFFSAMVAMKVLGETQYHMPRVTPPKKVNEWLPWVHIVISNFKRFILGTYHGVSSRHMQEYINEFCYRFNRRQWEFQIPSRLLAACATHLPVKTC